MRYFQDLNEIAKLYNLDADELNEIKDAVEWNGIAILPNGDTIELLTDDDGDHKPGFSYIAR